MKLVTNQKHPFISLLQYLFSIYVFLSLQNINWVENLKRNILLFAALPNSPYFQLTEIGLCMQGWERLEKAEHERELALRTELIRQEKLEQLARRFDRKAAMRETWLSENQRLVSQVRHIHTTCISLALLVHIYETFHLLLCLIFFSFWQTLVANCSTTVLQSRSF